MNHVIKDSPNPNPVVNIPDLVKDASVPFFFANGFQVGFTFADAHIVFKTHDIPTVVVNMGLPAVKSLYEQLALVIETYNQNTKQNILSLEEIARNFNSNK